MSSQPKIYCQNDTITIDKRLFVPLAKKTPDHLAFPEPKSGKHVIPRNDIRQKKTENPENPGRKIRDRSIYC
jgi:hypothetical protein